jgi:serine/threonine-protein kinase
MTDQLDRLKTALADRYAIEREIGAGGMATVYLAEDLKHRRKVAVKVLQPELAAVLGAERFLKEIEVTAILQHPHILPLHDSGQADNFLYYVMPFVEGESLRDRLNRETQLSVEDALQISREVADGMSYAHSLGVVHRDIKPENILLSGGHALVADFGIARGVTEAGGTRLTETGLSLGTPQYMSPEQATADRELDGRTDIYSLAATLYEMLAGEPPFAGPSAQAVVAKILTEEPAPVSKARQTVPSHVEAAIHQGLAKLPADRFASASRFAQALTDASLTRALVSSQTLTRARGERRQWMTGLLVVAAVVFFLTTVFALLRKPAAPTVARFNIMLPEAAALSTAIPGWTVAASPDGGHLAYVGPGRQLYVRAIDQLEARLLPSTEDSDSPFFSPDGEWIAYNGGTELKKVALSGGPPLTIDADVPQMRGGSWGPGNHIVYAPYGNGGLYLVSTGGAVRKLLISPDTAAGELAYRWPQFLPNGDGVVFAVYTGPEDAHLATYSIETGRMGHLAVNGLSAQYVESGHLLYLTREGSLAAVPFDVGELDVTGPPVSLVDGVMAKPTGAPEFSLSRTGTLVYLSGTPPDAVLVMVDADGNEQQLAAGLREPGAPRFSPDGERIALELEESGDEDIWIYDVPQAVRWRLTFEGENRYPTWSPDGSRIAFASLRGRAGVRRLLWKAADGEGFVNALHERNEDLWEVAWFPSGDSLIVRAGSVGDIQVVPADAGDSAHPLLASDFHERAPAISPDARWLAYVSDESGHAEVYVQPLGRPGGKRQVSSGGGTEPRWSPRGTELFYRSGDNPFGGEPIMAVAIQMDPVFAVGTHRELFEDQYLRDINHANYDVHPTNGEFVFLRAEASTSFHMTLVLNFMEESRRKLAQ